MNTRPLNVLVVDDSAFMRLALRRIIEAEGDLRVVGEAADGAAAIEQVRRLAPDAVAMDIEMPVMDGLEATRRLMAEPHPRHHHGQQPYQRRFGHGAGGVAGRRCRLAEQRYRAGRAGSWPS